VNPEACKREWPGFLYLLAKHKENGDFTDPSAHKPKPMFRMFLLWYFDSSHPPANPCLTKLVKILATLPVGSASVERSFSKMTLITGCSRKLFWGARNAISQNVLTIV
jgi:hypothetical protein